MTGDTSNSGQYPSPDFDASSILREEDCATERSAREYVRWVKERFALLASTEDGEKAIRLLYPIPVRDFMREIYPLHLIWCL